VLTGTARRGADGLTHVDLDGGGRLTSTETACGPVAVSVYPWEIVVEPYGAAPVGSARNHLPAEVISMTPVGGRVRVGLFAGQPLVAELSEAAVHELDLRPGARVTAAWKATATRLVAV
jgi:molybdate transport system ATP-binding protein